jgi:hypothetical protein
MPRRSNNTRRGTPVSARTHELTRAFYEWERRGRGWELYPYPVKLEPPFSSPRWHTSPHSADDTRRETLRSWLRRLFVRRLALPALARGEAATEPERSTGPPPTAEFTLLVPPSVAVPRDASEAWLRSLSTLSSTVSSELVGHGGRVEQRLACAPTDARLLRVGLQGVVPEAVIAPAARPLNELFRVAGTTSTAVLECGLGREFMIPLAPARTGLSDSLAALVAALADLAPDELAVVQVLWRPATAPWARAISKAVRTPTGQPFFADAPEITKLAAEKTSSPLFAVCLRVLAVAANSERVFEIVRAVAGALGRLGSPDRNEFIPLATGALDEIREDVLARQSRRLGMLLSARELAPLVTLPGAADERSPLLRLTPGKAAPARLFARGDGIVLGENHTGAEARTVRLPVSDRLRHTHIIGASGTGKSTLLARLILQDIEAGHGVAVLDPHGDLVDAVLGRLPDARASDVVVFDPSDPETLVGWNILEAGSETEKQVLSSDLVDVFRRLSTSWGDQMTAILANAVLTFLASTRRGTLLDLRRFLVEKPFRDEFLRTVSDPHLRSFWTTEFPLLASRRPHGPILTRLDTLLRHRLVREVVTARTRPLDFRALLDNRRVLLARLAQGAIGRENASLLGSLIVSKLYQAALSRQDADERSPFFLYIDEVHEFATPSLASMFSGARKFGLGVTAAHQNLYQLHAGHPEVERGVLGNAHVRVAFRVGSEDARKLAADFSGFAAEDFVRLGNWKTLCRVGSALDDFTLSTSPLPDVKPSDAAERRAQVLRESRESWGSPRPAVQEHVEPPEREAQPTTEPPRERVAPLSPVVKTAPERPLDTPPESSPSPAEGRGGPEHQYLQSLIREWAQARGFRVEVERELPSGGRVDLALTKGEERTACEVSVTTGAEHELENVRKCLAEGFARVFVVSLKRRFLHSLSERLNSELSPDERPRVEAVTPEELLAWLSNEPAAENTVAGYTVRTRYRTSGTTDQSERHRALTGVISRSINRLRRDEP